MSAAEIAIEAPRQKTCVALTLRPASLLILSRDYSVGRSRDDDLHVCCCAPSIRQPQANMGTPTLDIRFILSDTNRALEFG